MTYRLGKTSLKRLEGVHPDLVRVVHRAIILTEQDFTVMEGVRTMDRQIEYVRKGVSRTLNSKHLVQPDGYGHAVDLVPWENGQARWEWPLIYPIAAAMRQAAEEVGITLRWGGVWDRSLSELGYRDADMIAAVEAYVERHPGPDFIDGPHYELLS